MRIAGRPAKKEEPPQGSGPSIVATEQRSRKAPKPVAQSRIAPVRTMLQVQNDSLGE